jgi:hypothetical protein
MESVISTRGIPSHECLNCGSDTFKILVKFEDYEIAWYTTSGYCAACGAEVTVPTPLDNPLEV